MNTTAVKDDDCYLLNGSKNFITHGKSGDIAVVIARTGEKGDSRGMSAFIVAENPGFSGAKKEDKLGMRASETAELVFDNCRIPKENLIGNEGDGFAKQSLKLLDGGRISIGALSLGISKGAYEAALKYSKERFQFWQTYFCFHESFKLSDMATEIAASELLIHKAPENKGQKVTVQVQWQKCFLAKLVLK